METHFATCISVNVDSTLPRVAEINYFIVFDHEDVELSKFSAQFFSVLVCVDSLISLLFFFCLLISYIFCEFFSQTIWLIRIFCACCLCA